jgi:hypothetical protein
MNLRYEDRTIKSVGEMLTALKEQAKAKQPIWFRGHGRKDWKLVPALARVTSHLQAEGALIKRFMQNATPHITVPLRDEWEWMFLMQHYDVETRLLTGVRVRWQRFISPCLTGRTQRAVRFGVSIRWP